MIQSLIQTLSRPIIQFGMMILLFYCHQLNASTELAKINEKVITLEEFNRRYEENLKFFPLKPPSKKDVLNSLIQRELGIQEAKNQSLEKNPEIADRVNTILFNSFVEKSLAKEIENLRVSTEETKDFYNSAPIIRTSHILVALPPDAKEDAQKRALDKMEKILAELKKNKNFAEVAQKFSDGPAAALGGDIDYQSKDRLDPDYYATALKLKTPGQISQVVRTQFGYQVIRLTGIKPWKEVDQVFFKRAKLEEKKTKIFDQLMAKLKSKAQITIHPELITE
jgi:peptidyl-prolyl cis-trans isomerase C